VTGDRAVEARPAATVVLIRPGSGGPEILLIQRPETMVFGGGLHAFPGGRVDPGDSDPRARALSALSADAAAAALGRNVDPMTALALHLAGLRELFEEAGVLLAGPLRDGLDRDTLAERREGLLAGRLDLAAAMDGLDARLLTDRLAPIAHWTTPGFMPRRFSTWFFVADLPAGIEPQFAAGEVAAHRWVSAREALDLLAAGEIAMWVPTTSVLERLIEIHPATAGEVPDRLSIGFAAAPEVLEDSLLEVRWRFHAAGGLPGRTCETRLLGRRTVILVDPGDPTEEAVAAITLAVRQREATISAIVLTASDPDHAGGAEAIAIPHGIPILVAPGAGRYLPYSTTEIGDGEQLPADVDVRVELAAAAPAGLTLVPSSAGE
jgi:8-oxo-dGTP pyrophosphatase MutT (NUDIX family)